jgi:hypothetical protein
MRIPPDATIAPEKLTKYLLVHGPWDDKSGFLRRAGFTPDNWMALRDAIRGLADSAEARESGVNEYGTFFRLEGRLVGPEDSLNVALIWMRRAIDQKCYFVTLVPRKEQVE